MKSDKTMIKAIVFDMGGVLVDLDMQACIRAFKERAGFSDIEDILDCCHQKGIIASRTSGATCVVALLSK